MNYYFYHCYNYYIKGELVQYNELLLLPLL